MSSGCGLNPHPCFHWVCHVLGVNCCWPEHPLGCPAKWRLRTFLPVECPHHQTWGSVLWCFWGHFFMVAVGRGSSSAHRWINGDLSTHSLPSLVVVLVFCALFPNPSLTKAQDSKTVVLPAADYCPYHELTSLKLRTVPFFLRSLLLKDFGLFRALTNLLAPVIRY